VSAEKKQTDEAAPDDRSPSKGKRAYKASTKATSMLCLLLIGGYLVISPMVSHQFYYMLLFPRALYPKGDYKNAYVDKIKAQDLYFTAGEQKLHAWYFHKPDSRKLFLFHHGNGSNLSILKWYVRVALNCGASVLVYDYEGYGKSTGSPSIQAVCRDSDAAYEFAKNNLGWKENAIVQMGLSLGSGLATRLAAKHQNAALILFAPYTSLHKTCRSILPWLNYYPDELMHEPDINSLKNMTNVKCPVLIFHGKHDQMMPMANAEELKIQSKSLTQVVELNCGHGDLYLEENNIQKVLKRFMEENLSEH